VSRQLAQGCYPVDGRAGTRTQDWVGRGPECQGVNYYATKPLVSRPDTQLPSPSCLSNLIKTF